MTETTQNNIFGFNPFDEDVPQFEKTATFFFPTESEQESSASTQISDGERDPSVRFTPEKDKNIKIKMKGKTYTIRLDSSQKKRRERNNFDSPNQNIGERLETLPQIVKSERRRSEKQSFPSIHSISFSDSKRTTPSIISKMSQPSTETNSMLEISFDNEKNGNIMIVDPIDQSVSQHSQKNDNSFFDSPAKPKEVIVLKKFTPNNNNNNSLSRPQNWQPSPLQESNLIKKPKSILKLKRNLNSSENNNNIVQFGSMSSEGNRTKKLPSEFLPVTERKEKSRLKLESLTQFSIPNVYPNTTTNTTLTSVASEPKFLLKNQPYFLHPQKNAFKFQEAHSLEEEYIPKLATSLELKSFATSARGDLPLISDNKTKYLSEVLDRKKRHSSKFRPQEMILDKIFNPSSCRNQKTQEFSFPNH